MFKSSSDSIGPYEKIAAKINKQFKYELTKNAVLDSGHKYL